VHVEVRRADVHNELIAPLVAAVQPRLHGPPPLELPVDKQRVVVVLDRPVALVALVKLDAHPEVLRRAVWLDVLRPDAKLGVKPIAPPEGLRLPHHHVPAREVRRPAVPEPDGKGVFLVPLVRLVLHVGDRHEHVLCTVCPPVCDARLRPPHLVRDPLAGEKRPRLCREDRVAVHSRKHLLRRPCLREHLLAGIIAVHVHSLALVQGDWEEPLPVVRQVDVVRVDAVVHRPPRDADTADDRTEICVHVWFAAAGNPKLLPPAVAHVDRPRNDAVARALSVQNQADAVDLVLPVVPLLELQVLKRGDVHGVRLAHRPRV